MPHGRQERTRPERQATATAASPAGLTSAEVDERVAKGLVNDVPEAPTRTLAEIVRANVLTPFNFLLGSLLVVILVVGPLQDALFGLVLVANTLVGIVQEVRAKRTLERLAMIGAPTARVVRDGTTREVGVGEVVLDDLLVAGPGEQVVVDGEVRQATAAEVDESLLTGESEPVGKRPGEPMLSGSFVVAGTLAYQATKVGREAYAAQLAEQARRFTLARSELRAGVDRIVKAVAWLLVPTAALLLASQLRSLGVRAALRGAVAGTVHMVPEGLVLLVSVAFAVAVSCDARSDKNLSRFASCLFFRSSRISRCAWVKPPRMLVASLMFCSLVSVCCCSISVICEVSLACDSRDCRSLSPIDRHERKKKSVSKARIVTPAALGTGTFLKGRDLK